MQNKCPHGECIWRLVRGGKRQECTRCGNSFPCKTACEHLDCEDARKLIETTPAWFQAYE